MSEKGKEAGIAVTAEELARINRFAKKELRAEEVYTFAVKLCDNEVDRDFERFDRAALEKLAELFVGRTGIFDHSWSAGGQTARIYRAEVIEEETRTTAGDKYCWCKGWAYMLRTEKNAELIAEIEGGIKKEVSVGCSAAKRSCSICGKDAGLCEHERGKYYGGKLCYAVLSDITDAYEWSFVAVPAQRAAGVVKRFGQDEGSLKAMVRACGSRAQVRELEELQDFWKVFPSLKEELFDGDGGYVQVKAQNVRQAIEGNPEVQAFRKQYQEALAGLEDRLTDLLIDQAQTVSIARAEDEITNELFRRMESVPLVDPYEAYELFHSHYEKISGDLELIQTEGKETVTQVDPNMVLKKKNGSDAEVQEGWKGHILPFELVQKTLLAREYEAIEDKKKRLQEIPSERDALLEELDEEEKEAIAEALDENREAFVLNKVGSVLKELKKEKDPENAGVITCLQKADQLSQEEKKIKAEIKTKEEAFELLTKEKIENLTSSEADALLKQKWILPIMDGIQSLPANAITALEKSVEALGKKYADTYEDIESEIRKTEDSLSQMLGQLTGSEADLAGIAELRKLLGGEF